MLIGLWIVLGIIVLLLFFFIAIYNGLVGLRNQVKNAWAQIDVQLKRRYDLIPTWWKRSRATPSTSARSLKCHQGSQYGAGGICL